MEKLLFRKLITDITLRALIITFSIGLIVWIIQAVNYLDFVIDDGHNFKIYFLFNLYNFPKIVHRILPFVFAISLFFELIKYEKNNELLIFWTNGISKKRFINNIIKFTFLVTVIQILWGSYFAPSSQFKARLFLKTSNMDFLPNLIKQGKFIDTVSGLTIFINQKTDTNTFKNIYIQEGEFKNLSETNNQIIFAKEGYLIDNNKKLFRLIDGKIISTNNNKLISFQFDKIDYDYITARKKADAIEAEVNLIEKVIEEKPRSAVKSIDRLKKKIRRMRKAGLNSPEQEYSPENIAFKILRREETLDKINNLKYDAYDKVMSIGLG